MADRYVDGYKLTNGAGTISDPYNTVNSVSVVDGDRIFLKRGTVCQHTANSKFPAGSITVRDYGPAEAPMPILYAANPAAIQFAALGTSPLNIVTWENIDARGPENNLISGTAFYGTRGCTLRVINCRARNWAVGIRFGGQNAYLVGNDLMNCPSAIYGGEGGFAAPSNSWVYKNICRGRADGITLHDGTGIGYNNRIVMNDLFGNTENAVDLLTQFRGTHVLFNRCETGTTVYPVITQSGCDDTLIMGNLIISNGYSGAYVRAIRNKFIGNKVWVFNGTSNHGCLGLDPTATDCDVYNNTFYYGIGGQRSVIRMFAGSSGRFRNNCVINMTAAGIATMDLTNPATEAAWTMNNNCYWAPSYQSVGNAGTPHLYDGTASRIFSDWQGISGNDAQGMYADPLVEMNVRPDTFAIPTPSLDFLSDLSPLRGAGAFLNYVSRDCYGRPYLNPPSIGAVERLVAPIPRI